MLFSIFAAPMLRPVAAATADDAKARYEADIAWANERGHLVISNGPYILDKYVPENLYLKLVKFNGERNVFTDTLPHDGYADVIEYQGVQGQENVILQIAKGEFDMGMFAFSAGTYSGLGEDITSNLNLFKSASSYNELSFNTYHDPDKDAPIVTVGDQVYFNPFAIREVRFAMNWLVNREYIVQNIYQGSGAPMLGCIRPSHPADKYFEPVYDALGLTPEGDEQLGIEMITEAMEAAKDKVAQYGHELKLEGGYWTFDGKPIEINFIIRIEDERKDIGLYVSKQLQKAGFKVNELLWDRQKAGGVVFAEPPSNYKWNIYTGGWGTSGLPSVWIDDYTAWFYAAWYGYVPGAVEPKHKNTVTVQDFLEEVGDGDADAGLQAIGATYYKSASDLGDMLQWTEEELTQLLTLFNVEINGKTYTLDNADQYWDLQKISMGIGIMESARVFIVEQWEFYPANKQRISKILSDPNVGIGQRWSVMSAETPDKTLKIAQFASTGALFMSAFQPVGGLSDVYSVRIWNLVHDFGGTNNFDGVYTPYRCKWELEKGEFTVPESAVIYNQTEGWVAANAGETAPVKVKVTCDFTEWHNGMKMSIDDLKYYIAFLYTWAYQDGPDDKYYDEGLSGTAASLQNILGFEFTDDGYVAYGTYKHPIADDITAGFYVFYPSLPWEIYYAMGELVANANAYGIDKVYSFSSSGEGVNWLDLLTKEHVDDLVTVMKQLEANNPVPAPISGETPTPTQTTTTQTTTTTEQPSGEKTVTVTETVKETVTKTNTETITQTTTVTETAQGGVCGPAAIGLFALLPLLALRKKRE
ncbi:ABC transporter substrate-binding protein [Palaeococcus ferrophilus]|uniref:ABC transporter substrate-binding protein n=1 Tax=Palaeococcus ferrophilus TaxID=83868 RepID=UPI00064E6D69|nr:ABC transporter substrate-binding protein [Palaeococcus ferrophilus]